jgi:hypothetical protein
MMNPDPLVYSAERHIELQEIRRNKMIVHEKLERSCLKKYIVDQIEVYIAKMGAFQGVKNLNVMNAAHLNEERKDEYLRQKKEFESR